MRASFVMSGVGQGLRRNVLMSIALIMITFVSLYFLAGALLTQKEIGKFRNQYQEKLSVQVYMCGPAPYGPNNPCKHPFTGTEKLKLEATLKADPQIASVRFLTHQEIYNKNKDFLGKDNSALLQASDFPDEFTLGLKDLKRDYPAVAQRYAKAPGVYAVQNEDEGLKTILDIFDKSRIGALAFALVMLIAAILLMAITIQVAAAQRRNETNIMRLVGASRWMTQMPFVIEAMITAVIGGILTVPALWFSKTYVLNGIFGHSVSHGVLPDLSVNDVLVASGESALIGIVLAIVTAYVTLRSYVRI
jgi:cell division transport system permease protein